MTIPPLLLGLGCVLLAVLLTFVFPIQRARLSNQAWDLVTLALLVGGAWWLNLFDTLSNVGLGLIAGFIAILIRDFRLWLARFRGQAYRRSHRYYWYGRAWGRRRRY